MVQPARSARAAGKVSVAVFVSRILGLGREQVFAKLFGAGFYNDAWVAAFRIPNLFRDLVAEGALSAAFVPTFTDFLRHKGRADAWLLANLVLSWLLILLGGLALVFLFFSHYFVYLVAAGFGDVPGKIEVTSVLLKILSPFLILVAMASVAMGVLNSLNYFFLPALAPALFNFCMILAGFLLVPSFESWGILPIHTMAVGALMGGILQYSVQLPLLRKQGYRFRFRLDFHHEGVRKIARLLAPALLSVGAVQVNVVVNTQIASFLQENGPISWLTYAFRIIYLPIGLFGVAVGVVNLRDVSVLAAQRSWEKLRETVANSIKLVAFLVVPSTIGLMVLAVPIVGIIFERGHFTSRDTMYTAYAVIFYAAGLCAYSCMKVYVPTFYALGDTVTPVKVSLLAVLVNLVINLVLVFLILPVGYRYVGLALGTALSVTLASVLLARGFKVRLGSLRPFGVTRMFWKSFGSAVVMGLCVYLINRFFEQRWAEMTFLGELSVLLVCLTVGIVVYFGCCRLLGVEESRYFFHRLVF